MPEKPESQSLPDETSTGILNSTLKNHPVISLLTAAILLVVASVTITFAILDATLIETLKQRIEEVKSTSFLGTAVNVRRTINDSTSIIVLQGRMSEGDSAVSVDGNVLLGVSAIEGDMVTIEGCYLEWNQRFRIQSKPGHVIKNEGAILPGAPALHSYEISTESIEGSSAIVICRCVLADHNRKAP